MREIIVDSFAGGGGASTGIERAIGRSIDIAINHDPIAIAMHRTNHPNTEHFCENVWEVDPIKAAKGRPVALAWFSPDCKHFSKAKGGKPVEKQIRGLAWVTVRWAATVRPRVIILENVEEFKTWGPLLENGKPDPKKKGRTFQSFVNTLKRQGYQVDYRELRACDYGAPTIRKRLFLVARCDGRPIIWPRPTHGDPESADVKTGKLKPWRTAAEIIDWSLPCLSIFERKRPLAENTMRRIARGIQKFVLDNPRPFIIKVNHHGDIFRGQEIDQPMQTITAKNGWGVVAPVIGRQFGRSTGHQVNDPLTTITSKNEHLLVKPFIAKHYGGNYTGPGGDIKAPLPTITTKDHNALVAAFLTKYHGETSPAGVRGQVPDEPLRTLDTSNRFSLVTSHLIKFQQNNIGQELREPIHTIMATAGGLHVDDVRAFLLKYYSTGTIGQACDKPLQTVTTKHRFGLVMVHGQEYQIVDIGMRMLDPRELFAAQRFPESYVIDRDIDGNKFSKAQQVALCGNSVPPDFAESLIRANLPELCIPKNRDRFSVMDLEALLL
ncbi:MAG: DNA cytosine methyltransferase [Bacillota bacterium]